MKRIFIVVIALVIILFFWYFFLKPQDYQVSFQVKTVPGTVYETVKVWNSTLKGSKPVEFRSLKDFKQVLSVNDSLHIYEWNISSINDSLSQVTVNIKDAEHSLMNKIKIPFSDTNFEKGSRKMLVNFNRFLTDHLKTIKVTFNGEDNLFTTFCACIPLTTTQTKKAAGIMQNYSLLNSLLYESEVELNGPPFLEVLDWNLEADSLSYNFCYPIVRSEKLPKHDDVIYKRIFSKRALKAEYNGNYITSDRAWYTLLDHAERNGIPIEPKPIEVFYNNPNMGGDELKWKTDVFMPLKETNE
ncbi:MULTISPECIES: GyrI-like domain-containing protein [Flavobacteriaceae]|uniref:GyrI-like domain-containing protein n=1 Tax=Flavobacteriaceae TaxID=49546 RepID=UPI001490951A|nr:MULTISPECIES: GyrI-like domain-containing protein [Allomuricauda]MDC6365503.1 GyrI-like domain-containing protein [Muricauda sp. AC10]